jgi:hypothetical protein
VQCAYLRSLPKRPNTGFVFDDKKLIAWGYMPKPVEQVAEAQKEVAAEEAKVSETATA